MKIDREFVKEVLAGLIGFIGLIFWLWLFWVTGYMVIPPAKSEPSPVYEVTCWQEFVVAAAYEENGPVTFRVAGCKPGEGE